MTTPGHEAVISIRLEDNSTEVSVGAAHGRQGVPEFNKPMRTQRAVDANGRWTFTRTGRGDPITLRFTTLLTEAVGMLINGGNDFGLMWDRVTYRPFGTGDNLPQERGKAWLGGAIRITPEGCYVDWEFTFDGATDNTAQPET